MQCSKSLQGKFAFLSEIDVVRTAASVLVT